jgi:hypothetical protein
MQHHTLRETLARVADCKYLDAIPTRYRDWFAALVDQANAAEEAQRRYERALGRMLGGAVVDLTEGDRGT